jgi:RHS repeat-associated protein
LNHEASLAHGSSAEPYLFTGEPRDLETGFTFLRARYYDPSIGRFMSRDRWAGLGAVPQSLNRYTYARNGPLTHADHSGYLIPEPPSFPLRLDGPPSTGFASAIDDDSSGGCLDEAACTPAVPNLGTDPDCRALCTTFTLPLLAAPIDEQYVDAVRTGRVPLTSPSGPPPSFEEVRAEGSEWQSIAKFIEPATARRYAGLTSV